ncbi:copper amine oxidase N-terminal domain-containing protein [Paenibacillus tarimensis]|uniref:copper amine oxidase N-terminal domain-containing protein n=1 Tax=Paenibacillus tarimensis TaxID=416012 RepID=UPI001F2EE873|nr:copper amine oxidase N-terminal domain-containing protein [Paenibacillus tarimensis]MCF2945024.1 copper amine oxidase N-terminal domain-containing protein [Paenibacillus tarimensis]
MKIRPGQTRDKPSGSGRACRRRDAKRMLAAFSASVLLLGVLLGSFVYAVDPLQHYRKPSWYPPIYSSEQRYQNPGLARNYEYDTIIIGTSMTENFLPSEVDAALGGQTLKLSIRGSTAAEQYEIARLALQTGKPKRVLWGLDYFALRDGMRDDQGPFPGYLYDDKLWNDYRYWFNEFTYRQLFSEIIRQLLNDRKQELEHLYNWNSRVQFGEEHVLKHYAKARQSEVYFGLSETPIEVVQENFNRYILPLVQDYSEVEFIFYYPPYSVLRHAVWQEANEQRFENQLTMKKWIQERFSRMSNVRVYDFQAKADWTFNLDLYKDLSHHTQELNSQIIRLIGRDDSRYRVTLDNVEQFNEQLRQQIREAAASMTYGLHRYRIFKQEGKRLQPVSFSRHETAADGELLVPAKQAAELLEAGLAWSPEDKMLTLKGESHELQLTVGSNAARLDGSPVDTPVPAKLTSGTTMIPLRYAASALGWTTEAQPPDLRDHIWTLSLDGNRQQP